MYTTPYISFFVTIMLIMEKLPVAGCNLAVLEIIYYTSMLSLHVESYRLYDY